MRILHVQKVAGIGGSERHLASLLPAQAAAGDEVKMIALVTDGGDRFVDALGRSGMDVRTLRAGPDVHPFLVRDLVREIRSFHPDLVHTHLIHADTHGQLAARMAGVPGVSSLHSVHAFYRREPYRSAARAAGRMASRTIAISHYVKSYARALKLAPPGRLRVVPYGIDVQAWTETQSQRGAARARFDIAPDDVAIGMASRLIPGKGHRTAIDAAAVALAKTPRLRLLIAGAGPLEAELVARAAAVPGERVRLVGFVEDARTLMSAVDVLCFPTEPELGEGFGLAALEAMAAMRPVIAARVASLPELVVDGENGLLVPPKDAARLSSAFVELAGDPELRTGMGERGRERAHASFGLDAMVSRTHAVYEEALE